MIFLVAFGVVTAYLLYYVSKFFFYLLCVFALLITVCTAAKAADWSKPGHNPYVLSVPDAVDNYKDIPKPTRDKLKAMMQPPHKPTDTVLIGASTITGSQEYTGLRDMHWGKARTFTPGPVTRNLWSPEDRQRAFVYCADGYCIAVPFICRNVSRIDVLPQEELKSEPIVTVIAETSPSFEEQSAPMVAEAAATEFISYVPITQYLTQTQFLTNTVHVHTFVERNDPVFAAPVPEPSTYALVIVGILGIMFVAKRKRQQ